MSIRIMGKCRGLYLRSVNVQCCAACPPTVTAACCGCVILVLLLIASELRLSHHAAPGRGCYAGVDGAAGGKGARTRGAARVSSGDAPGCSAIGSVGSSGAAEPGVATGAAAAVSKLDMSITAERLYVAGRLLHLRRPPRASADAVEGAPPPGAAAAGGAAAAAGDGGAGGDLEEMVLVDGDPMDARFEFIAVRSTWVSDHSLTAMLAALKAASRHSPQ